MAVKIGDLAKTVMKELDDYGVAVGLEVEKYPGKLQRIQPKR